MSQRYTIIKSRTPATIQTAVVAICALLLFVTTSSIVRIIDNVIPADTRMLALIVRLVLLVIAGLAVITTWFRDINKRYYVEDGRLIIENTSLSGHSEQTVVTMKHSPTLSLSLPFLGKLFGYGTIAIEIDSYSRKTEYLLRHIEHPQKTLAELKTRLK